MIDEMKIYGLNKPSFESLKGDFIVCFHGMENEDTPQDTPQDEILIMIINFCKEPHSRKEIADYVGMKDVRYLRDAYLIKLLENKLIKMTLPDKPTSKNQKYVKIK